MKNTAMTERSVMRLARKCIEAEEAGRMLKILLKKGFMSGQQEEEMDLMVYVKRLKQLQNFVLREGRTCTLLGQ